MVSNGLRRMDRFVCRVGDVDLDSGPQGPKIVLLSDFQRPVSPIGLFVASIMCLISDLFYFSLSNWTLKENCWPAATGSSVSTCIP